MATQMHVVKRGPVTMLYSERIDGKKVTNYHCCLECCCGQLVWLNDTDPTRLRERANAANGRPCYELIP